MLFLFFLFFSLLFFPRTSGFEVEHCVVSRNVRDHHPTSVKWVEGRDKWFDEIEAQGESLHTQPLFWREECFLAGHVSIKLHTHTHTHTGTHTGTHQF